MAASPTSVWTRWLRRQELLMPRWDRIRFAGMAPRFAGQYRAGWLNRRIVGFAWIEEN